MKAALRGFAVGSLALIALYVVVQPGASQKTEVASNVVVAGLRRLLSPQTAGIGDHSKTDATDSRKGGRVNPADAATADTPQGMLFTT